MRTWRSQLCVLAAAAVPCIASAQTPLLQEDFESGAPGWTFANLWHIEADSNSCASTLVPFPSGAHCAWYGSSASCNFDVPSACCGPAILALPFPIPLPTNAASVVLRYRRALESEMCVEGFDRSSVQISIDTGLTWLTAGTDCAWNWLGHAPWVRKRIDLTPYAGQSVRLRFEFVPQDDISNYELGWWIDDVTIATEPGVPACTAAFGCPCPLQYVGSPNSYILPNEDSGGCVNSGHDETELYGTGTASVANDTLQLLAADLPASTVALYVQGGVAAQPVTFGDGRRCIGAPFVRLAIHPGVQGTDAYPQAGETGIALKGSVPPGGATRRYQVVYRDAASWCTSSTFNVSNGYTIAWRP